MLIPVHVVIFVEFWGKKRKKYKTIPVLSCHLISGVAAHTTWRGIYYRPGDSGQAAKCPALN
jgi:hypothetical protein